MRGVTFFHSTTTLENSDNLSVPLFYYVDILLLA
ncbi:unnamed protein product, partial [marine sediment metagenome]